MLCNLLVAKMLSKNEWVFRSCFIFPRCETCLIGRRYMVFRASRRGLSRCDWAGIVARNMPNGECATRNWDGEHGKTMVPLSGSSKNDAQLLYQNITQNVLRKTGETGDDASRSVTPIGHSTETGGGCWFDGSFQRLSAFLSACYFQSLLAIARNGFTAPVVTCSKQTLTIIRNSVGFNSNDT